MQSRVRLLTQLPSNGLYEGFVALPNGALLVARADAPELYRIDVGADGADEVQLLSTFQEAPGINGIINICGIPGHDDEFIVLVGLIDLQAVRVSNYQIWRFSMSTTTGHDDGAKWKRVVALNGSGFYLSMVTISERVLLVTDSARYRVYSVDLVTGSTEVLVTHASFKAATPADFFGINRLSLGEGGLIWFTNSSQHLLGRFCVESPAAAAAAAADKEGAPSTATARLVGDVEIVAKGLPACDGFAVFPDGSAAFLVTMHEGKLVRLDLAGGRGESISDVGLALVNPSAVGLIPPGPGPGAEDGGGGLQLCVICNGEFEVTWKDHDPNAGWQDIADIVDRVTVTVMVTEE
ncbi:hypothetical protein PG997_005534 [Apiospora hydei]|uniref:Uncharacterized protein n=1 Tax=Apiospora hydei TaxID=1337664 RepID=A0ABR1WLE0_9PEZI